MPNRKFFHGPLVSLTSEFLFGPRAPPYSQESPIGRSGAFYALRSFILIGDYALVCCPALTPPPTFGLFLSVLATLWAEEFIIFYGMGPCLLHLFLPFLEAIAELF
jgi:hypothetical protein